MHCAAPGVWTRFVWRPYSGGWTWAGHLQRLWAHQSIVGMCSACQAPSHQSWHCPKWCWRVPWRENSKITWCADACRWSLFSGSASEHDRSDSRLSTCFSCHVVFAWDSLVGYAFRKHLRCSAIEEQRAVVQQQDSDRSCMPHHVPIQRTSRWGRQQILLWEVSGLGYLFPGLMPPVWRASKIFKEMEVVASWMRSFQAFQSSPASLDHRCRNCLNFFRAAWKRESGQSTAWQGLSDCHSVVPCRSHLIIQDFLKRGVLRLPQSGLLLIFYFTQGVLTPVVWWCETERRKLMKVMNPQSPNQFRYLTCSAIRRVNVFFLHRILRQTILMLGFSVSTSAWRIPIQTARLYGLPIEPCSHRGKFMGFSDNDKVLAKSVLTCFTKALQLGVGQNLSYLRSLLDDFERIREKQTRLECIFFDPNRLARALPKWSANPCPTLNQSQALNRELRWSGKPCWTSSVNILHQCTVCVYGNLAVQRINNLHFQTRQFQGSAECVETEACAPNGTSLHLGIVIQNEGKNQWRILANYIKSKYLGPMRSFGYCHVGLWSAFENGLEDQFPSFRHSSAILIQATGPPWPWRMTWLAGRDLRLGCMMGKVNHYHCEHCHHPW